MNSLEFIDVATHHLPGSRLSGQVTWNLDSAPGMIDIEVFWRTVGKGSEDRETVFKHRLPALSSSGSAPFSCPLPSSPKSFSGRILSISWNISLRIDNPHIYHEEPIWVSDHPQQPRPDNPFATRQTDALPFVFLTKSMPEIMADLARQKYTGSIVGPKGSGKTTLVRELRSELSQLGFDTPHLRFSSEQKKDQGAALHRFIHELTASSVAIIDGAEQLKGWRWRIAKYRILKRATGLIITTHRSGRLPVVLRTSTSKELVIGLMHQLNIDGFDEASIHKRLESHNGNIRDLFREMYDEIAVR